MVLLGFIQGAEPTGDASLGVPLFLRDVSDTYKGAWASVSSGQTWANVRSEVIRQYAPEYVARGRLADIGGVAPSTEGTAPKDANVEGGGVHMTMASSRTQAGDPYLMYVKVDVIVRSEAHDDVTYALEGVYNTSSGQIRAVSNGHKLASFFEHGAGDPQGDSPNGLVENREELYLKDGEEFTRSNTSSSCIARLFGQISPVSAEAQLSSEKQHGMAEVSFLGLLESPNCPAMCVVLEVSAVQLELYVAKASSYSVFLCLLTVYQVFLTIQQIEWSMGRGGHTSVSLYSVGLQAMMDAYLCLVHLTAGIVVDPLFSNFAGLSLLEFSLFSVFELRYVLLIWKARRSRESPQDWEAIRRELGSLYSRFYVLVLGGIMLLAFSPQLAWALCYICLYGWWVPQIVLNCAGETRESLHPRYLFGMTVTRLQLPLYILACPRNFLRQPTRLGSAAGLTGWVAVQICTIYLQDLLGPRFFLPKAVQARIWGERYDYFAAAAKAHAKAVREKAESSSQLDEEALGSPPATTCSICMESIPLHESMESFPANIMLSPCGHFFHEGCLTRWVEVKYDCPMCRTRLPAL